MSEMPGDTARGRGPVTDTEDGRWLSYTELAAERGISRASAIRMVRRQRWRRQAGNDGEARVFVPIDALPGDETGGRDTGQTPDMPPGDLSALEDAVAALRERAEAAERRAEAAEADRRQADARADAAMAHVDQVTAMLADAAARADRADAALTGERVRADALRDRAKSREDDLALIRAALDQAQTEARNAHAEAQAIRHADEARKARGRWARFRDAWRGD